MDISLIVFIIVVALIYWWYLWKTRYEDMFATSKPFLIKREVFPMYKKLEKEYNAKWPAVMKHIIFGEFPELCGLDNKTAYFFVQGETFRIISIARDDLDMTIPFSDVLYQNCYIGGSSYEDAYWNFDFLIKYNGEERFLRFQNIKHECRKRGYDDRPRLFGLYNFIRENFPEDKECWSNWMDKKWQKESLASKAKKNKE